MGFCEIPGTPSDQGVLSWVMPWKWIVVLLGRLLWTKNYEALSALEGRVVDQLSRVFGASSYLDIISLV